MMHFTGTERPARMTLELGRGARLIAVCGDLTARHRAPPLRLVPTGT